MTKRRIIVVLGMHRSGTSAITRGLKALNVELGDNLLPASRGDNDKGFWEDVDLYKFNEALLAKAGNGWDRMSALDAHQLCRDSYTSERIEAAAILERKLESMPLFGFKDPRTAVLLPFWRCVFDDLGLDDNYIIALRNPLEAAESLRKRNGHDRVHGLMLWLKFTWAAVVNSDGKPRLCVGYRNMMVDPAAQLWRIAAAFNLSPPSPKSPEFLEYANEFLAPALNRNRISDNEIRRSDTLPPAIPALYARLLEWSQAEPGTDLELPAKLKSQIDSFLASSEPLLRLGDQLKSLAATANAKANATEKARGELAAALEQLKTAHQDTLKSLSDAKALADNQTQKLQQRHQQVSELHTHGDSQAAEIARLKAEADKLTTRVTELQELLARASTAEASAAASRDEARAALQAAQAELISRNRELEAARISREVDVGKLTARVAELQGLVAKANAAETSSASALAETRAALETAQSQLAARNEELEAARASQAETEKKLAAHIAELQAFVDKASAAEAASASALAEMRAALEGAQASQAETEEKHKARITEMRAALEAARASQSETEDKFRARITEMQTALGAAQSQLASRSQELAAAQATRAETEEKLRKAENDLSSRTKDLRLLRHEVRSLQTERQALEASAGEQLNQSRTEAERHKSQAQRIREEIELVRAELARLGSADEMLQTMRRTLSTVQAELQATKTALSAQTSANAGLQSTVTRLQQEMGEKTLTLRLLRHEVHALQSSTSWRVTKPMRALSSMLTRIRGKLTKS